MITFSRRSILLMMLLFPFFVSAQDTEFDVMGEVGAVKEELPESKLEKKFKDFKIKDPKSVHDYFINELCDTALNVIYRQRYLYQKDLGAKEEEPAKKNTLVHVEHLFEKGAEQFEARGPLIGMLSDFIQDEKEGIAKDPKKSNGLLDKFMPKAQQLLDGGYPPNDMAKKIEGYVDKFAPRWMKESHHEESVDFTYKQFSSIIEISSLNAVEAYLPEGKSIKPAIVLATQVAAVDENKGKTEKVTEKKSTK